MAKRKVSEVSVETTTPNWDEIRQDWENRVDEVAIKARRVEVLKDIYEKVYHGMEWDAMEYHSSDEEHEDTWFTYDPEGWSAWKYPIYQEVLKLIADLANEQ